MKERDNEDNENQTRAHVHRRRRETEREHRSRLVPSQEEGSRKTTYVKLALHSRKTFSYSFGNLFQLLQSFQEQKSTSSIEWSNQIFYSTKDDRENLKLLYFRNGILPSYSSKNCPYSTGKLFQRLTEYNSMSSIQGYIQIFDSSKYDFWAHRWRWRKSENQTLSYRRSDCTTGQSWSSSTLDHAGAVGTSS